MDKFVPATYNPEPWGVFLEKFKDAYPHMTKEEESLLREKYDDTKNETVFINDTYTVSVNDNPDDVEHIFIGVPYKGELIHLSIKRNDREAIHDWRDLQEIKNQLVGKNHEAFEIYPSESRLVDTVNQYHLWVFKRSGVTIPVGFMERAIFSSSHAEKMGGKQR